MQQTLVLSSNKNLHGNWLPGMYARKLEKEGIPVVLTEVGWPRDSLYFSPDGHFEYIQKDTIQPDYSNNFAWNGGSYLQGNNFIVLSSTENPIAKQESTKRTLGVDAIYAHNIMKELNALSDISVSGNKRFFREDFAHMDIIFGILNRVRALVTYNHPMLIHKGLEIASEIGYRLLTLPLKDSQYASVGFVEFDDKVLLDGRARGTRKVLESIGYRVIATQLGLKKTNRAYGSLRCMTNIIPISAQNIEAKNIEDIPDHYDRSNARYAMFRFPDGRRVLTCRHSFNALRLRGEV